MQLHRRGAGMGGMTAAAERPSNQDRVKAAHWFAQQGFGIFPVWSTTDSGRCKCPDGSSCSSPGKHPITPDGFKSATTDPHRIETFLSAASEPNYGMLCPEGVFAWDVDTDEERGRLARLVDEHGDLPATLRTDTAHGQHVFWRWPEGLPRPIRQMFGMVTRWGSGKMSGYVIGPRSVHQSGAQYRPAEGTPFAIATLPEAWARAALGDPDSIRITGRKEATEVQVGHRHDHLRDTARYYAGTVRDPDALFAAVWAENQKLPSPKTEDEVRRAVGEVLARFGPDPVEEDPDTGEDRPVRLSEPPMMSPTDDESLFPAPLAQAAYSGRLLGQVTDHLLGGTDASPVAILASLLSFCGALVPSWGYWHGRHTSSPFLALVGRSGIGRKGTAMFRVRDALGYTLGMDTVNRVRFDGVASGEALVKSLLDRSQVTFGVPTGLLFEEEYATFLAASGREGSNLDSRMRSAFDGKQLAHRKVGETLYVAEPYWLSGLVAITPTELQGKVTKASFKNGSGNRWLWLPVERRPARVVSTEPILPEELSLAIEDAHHATFKTPVRVDPGPGVDDLLSEYDDFLRADSVGLAADMTTRYGVIAFRIGLVHAAVERSEVVTRDHITSAIALTEYARAGLGYCFGDALGDESSTYLLRMLLESEEGELPQWTITRHFIRDPIKRQAAIDDLVRLGLAEVVKTKTRGRTAAALRLVPRRRSRTDFLHFFPLFATAHNSEDTPEMGSDAPNRGNNGNKVDLSVNGAVRKREEGGKKGHETDPEPVVDQRTGEVKDATAEWAEGRPCADFRAHQLLAFRGGDGLWRCPECHPPEEET